MIFLSFLPATVKHDVRSAKFLQIYESPCLATSRDARSTTSLVTNAAPASGRLNPAFRLPDSLSYPRQRVRDVPQEGLLTS